MPSARATLGPCLLLALPLIAGAAEQEAPTPPVPPAAAAAEAPILHVTGMTFVGSRDSAREILVRSERAKFHTDTKVAELEGVRAEVSEGGDNKRFSMTCERAELDLQKNDFRAEGNVEGRTDEGQRVFAPWVRYDHA